jgi:signal transduction histidine kinase
MRISIRKLLPQVLDSLRIPTPEESQLLKQIRIVERDLLLPVRIAGIVMVAYALEKTPWFRLSLGTFEAALESVRLCFWGYIVVSALCALLLMTMQRLPGVMVRYVVIVGNVADAMFLSMLTFMTGGYDSILFWGFIALIIRNACSVPAGVTQILLNSATICSYAAAGLMDIWVSTRYVEELSTNTRQGLGFELPEHPAEAFLVRFVLLVLTTSIAYGLQVLLQKQQQAYEESRESATREAQLHMAGRMAGQIAHQIKNPLAIINNTAYSLRKAVKDGRPGAERHIDIIEEEVERADRIITQVMGYSRLAEGHVERLDVKSEIQGAIGEVFPEGGGFAAVLDVQVQPQLPPLLMQRAHLSEILLNLLTNAREATNGGGHIRIEAALRPDGAVQISVTDDGPGIPPELVERIFEAYFTTKEKGSGLGLAIARHNASLYGGTLTAESTLGNGSRFLVVFPSKTVDEPSG